MLGLIAKRRLKHHDEFVTNNIFVAGWNLLDVNGRK